MRTYSGGMRRKLDLAAALVDDPTVLFVDVVGSTARSSSCATRIRCCARASCGMSSTA